MTGRTKRTLAARLSNTLGVRVSAEAIWENANAEQVGCARWGVWVIRNNRNVNVYSWDTMTACMRHGFTVNEEDEGSICVVANK